jgi:hypothetical protein
MLMFNDIEDGKKSESLEARFSRCKNSVQSQDKSKSAAYAICSPLNPGISKTRRTQLKKSQIVNRTTSK